MNAIRQLISTLLLCLLLLGLLTSFGCGNTNSSDEITELSFGIISTESSTDLKKGFEPFLKDMEEALGIPVKTFFASDYAGVIEGMRFQKVHLGWFGNKSGIEAVDRANGEVFCQTVSADGSPGYWSLLITHKDAPYQTLEEIVDHGGELTFGNGDVNSTSGYLIPSYYLWAQRKIVPDQHFKNVITANHQANLLAVVNKQIDFATNNTESLAIFRKRHPDKADQVHVIWKSPIIPLDPLVWRKDLPDDLKKKIKDFFLGYGKGDDDEATRQREVLAGMSSGWAPFKDSSNAQLLPVREIMVAKELMRLERDPDVSDEDKAAEVKKLTEKLEVIRKKREALEKTQAAAS